MAPDSISVASHTLPKLSPSPNDHHPWNRTAQPGPVNMASVRPFFPSHTMSSTIGACHACDGGGAALLSSVEITCISRQYQVSGWLGFLTGDWDGDWDGVLPNASGSSGPFQPLAGVRVWLSEYWFKFSVHLDNLIWCPLT